LDKFYEAQKDFIDEEEISEQLMEELIPQLQDGIQVVIQAELNQKSENSEGSSDGMVAVKATTAQQDVEFMDVDIDKKAEALLTFMVSDASETALSKIQDKEYMERASAAAIKAQLGDTSDLEEFKKSEMNEATDKYRGILEKLWDIYDADRNGELDPEESKKLMQV